MTQIPPTSNSRFLELYQDAERFIKSENVDDRLYGAAILKWLHQQGTALIALGSVDKVAIEKIQEQLRQEITDL